MVPNEKTISVAIETSGRIGSVVLARGREVTCGRTFSTGNRHGVELLPAVEALCSETGLKAGEIGQVYVSGGPGSFTGLRVGITFAKALAYATGALVVRVPTLEVIAQNALAAGRSRPLRVVVLLDAKRCHVYCAAYELTGDAYRPLDAPAEREPRDYLGSVAPAAVLGDGVAYHRQAVEAVDGIEVLGEELNRGQAEVVHRMGRAMAAKGEFIEIDRLIPIYVRRPEAEEKWEARHGG